MLIQHADPRVDDLLFLEGAQGDIVVRDRPDLSAAYGRLAGRLTDSGRSGDAAATAVRSIRTDIVSW